MLWELLVTDGHVRAARLRFIAIPLVIVGVLLVLRAHPPEGLDFPSSGTADFSGFGADFQRRAAAPLNEKLSPAQLQFQSDVIKTITPSSEIPGVIDRINDSLKSNGAIPKDLPIKEISSDDFWSFKWSPTDIMHFQKDNVHVFGAIVTPPPSDGRYYGEMAVRWIGIFRQDDGQWRWASLANANHFYVPREATSVGPEEIPVTLRKLMNIEEFRP